MHASTKLRESAEALQAKQRELTAHFQKIGKEGWGEHDHERFQELEKEALELRADHKRWEGVAESERKNREELADQSKPARSHPGSTGLYTGETREVKSIGELFTESHAFKNFLAQGKSGDCVYEAKDFSISTMRNGYSLPEFKTDFTTTSFAPFVVRSNDVVPYAFRQVRLTNILPSVPTTMTSVKYMEETTHTANAAATAEAVALPESAIAYTERTVNIEDIGTTLPVSERMFDDVPFIVAQMNSLLGPEVDRALETQIVSGTGTSPQLQGFLSTAAATAGVQTQALGADNSITCLMKAMTLIEANAFASASAVVYHPTNWQNIVILQEPTTGRFIFGDPSQAGPRTLWGLPVVVTTAMTSGTGLVGDFAMYCYMADRAGVRIDIGWQNTDFAKRIRCLRAYVRQALVLRRPSAFCKMTSLT